MKKVVKISFLIFLCLIFLTVTVFADSATNIKKFLGQETEVEDDVKTVLDSALSVIQIIGLSVATIMLIVLGIKYITSSVSERAEVKKHAVIYVTGAILLFGATGIVEIIKQFATKAIK